MIPIDLGYVISQTVDVLYRSMNLYWNNQILNGSDMRDKGLLFSFQARADLSIETSAVSKYLYFLFSRPALGSAVMGTNTFGCVTDFDVNNFATKLSDLSWTFLSSHDSCWNSAVDGFISAVYFKTAREVIQKVPNNEGIPPKDVNWNVYSRLFTPFVQWVDVEIVSDVENPYKKILKKVSIPLDNKR